MSDFVVRVQTPLPPHEVWSRLWDLDRHTEVIPLTTVTPDPPAVELAAGVGFTGRTALGPLGFDDTMRVVAWRPPTAGEGGQAAIDKTGRVIAGRIAVEVTPFDGGTVVLWRQGVRLPWLPAPLRRLEALAARAAAPGYRRVLRTLLG